MSQHNKDLKQYTIGFFVSVILTVLAFLSVFADLSNNITILVLVSLAIAQLYVQLVFFLHFNKEQSPRWNIMMFLLAAWFVFAVVIGSIWIMANLDYNMQPDEADTYLIEREGIYNE